MQVRVGAAEGGQGAGQQDRARAGEPAQAHGRGLRRQPGQLARRRVDLVHHDGRPAQDDPAGRGEPYAVAAPFEQFGARSAFDRGDLAGHRGLGVAQRGGGRGEGSLLGDRAEDPQRGE